MKMSKLRETTIRLFMFIFVSLVLVYYLVLFVGTSDPSAESFLLLDYLVLLFCAVYCTIRQAIAVADAKYVWQSWWLNRELARFQAQNYPNLFRTEFNNKSKSAYDIGFLPSEYHVKVENPLNFHAIQDGEKGKSQVTQLSGTSQ